jgi:hypothetical protein
VATSDEPVGARVRDYLVSRKHLAGTAAALVGVALALGGVTGPLWPVVVASLYGAGALAAPSDAQPADVVRKLLQSAAREAAALIDDLGRIGASVRRAGAELPRGALAQFDQVEQMLASMLAHPNALADPHVLHVLSTTIRRDLDQIVGAYLRLPAHLRRRTMPSGDRTPADELVRQLRLLDDYVAFASERVFSSETRHIADLGAYLEARNQLERSDLDSPP